MTRTGRRAAHALALAMASALVLTSAFATPAPEIPAASTLEPEALASARMLPGPLHPEFAAQEGSQVGPLVGDMTRGADQSQATGGELNLTAAEWVGSPPEALPRLGPDELALKPVVGGPARLSDVPTPLVTARYVAIIDEDSGALLYGRDAHTRVPPASTTKIATTLVALERATNLNQPVRVTVSGSQMAAADGSSVMGLEPGERVSLETLLYGMMLPSGNDAAEQVALALAGSRERYVDWMNRAAVGLGLRNTHFANPSGMDARGHYSSAYDMAMLARHAMRHPAFRQMAAATHYYGDDYPMTNVNRLIGWYAGADGVKVGFTDEARKTIVASVTRGGHRVYVGLMRSEDLPGDCMALFDWVWDTFAW
jgi:D-alanyl-D-alanine carboxypeptidase